MRSGSWRASGSCGTTTCASSTPRRTRCVLEVQYCRVQYCGIKYRIRIVLFRIVLQYWYQCRYCCASSTPRRTRCILLFWYFSIGFTQSYSARVGVGVGIVALNRPHAVQGVLRCFRLAVLVLQDCSITARYLQDYSITVLVLVSVLVRLIDPTPYKVHFRSGVSIIVLAFWFFSVCFGVSISIVALNISYQCECCSMRIKHCSESTPGHARFMF